MMQNAIRTIRTLLPATGSITRAMVEEKVKIILQIPQYSALDRELLIRHIETLYKIYQGDFRIIEKNERRRPWLNDKSADIDFNGGFWGRYRSYLGDEKNLAPETINKLNRLTDRTLDNLFDPMENVQIDKKGLVVGQVQSGKTANYTGLICKAADAGFKLIIVLAGIHNNLRSQTQLRLDEGFLGFDTQHTRAFTRNNISIGVGQLGHHNVAHSLTSSADKGDFTKPAANSLGINFNTNEPIVAVIKKNPGVLRRVHEWLSAHASGESGNVIQNKALLLIDDEADNASINISNDPEKRSTINNWITSILSLFRKNAYVGYTATPFANIFIPREEDNLFPRDFIVNIPAPSNYIGPEKIFGFSFDEDSEDRDSTLPVVNRIKDYYTFVPNQHKKDDQLPSSLPESLKRAIRCFILSCAVRRLRGQVDVHNSMLIHVSRFVRWQDHITELVDDQLNYYRMGVDQNDSGIIEQLKETYLVDEDDYKCYRTVSEQILNSTLQDIDPEIQDHSWQDVQQHLYDAVSRIQVKAIHGGSGETLEYYNHKKGLSVIAVGGNKLSRGLTLEGLSVSYYLRASKMYDTLMQMGRWFGYRTGYVDLCRLFTSRELNEWFCHITHASEELRKEFDYMTDIAGSSPEDYALKVRTHPGVLQISAANKIKAAVTIRVSWAGRLVESYEFKKDVRVIDNNLTATRQFIAGLGDTHKVLNEGHYWKNIKSNLVMQWLEKLQTVESLKAYEPRNLISFIKKQEPNNELTEWRVILMSKKNASSSTSFKAGEQRDIGHWKRSQDEHSSDETIYYVKKSHIISPQHEFLDLKKEEYELAMHLTDENRKTREPYKKPTYPSGEIVRNKIRDPRHPLLLIYLLDPEEGNTRMPEGTNPFVGYAISFPKSNHDAPVAYSVHNELLDQFNNGYEEEDYDIDD